MKENVESVRPKMCRINWIGPKVKAMKKMGALQGKDTIAKLWQGAAVELDATSKDDIQAEALKRSLLNCGGAHKPTMYDFGGVTIDLAGQIPN